MSRWLPLCLLHPLSTKKVLSTKWAYYRAISKLVSQVKLKIIWLFPPLSSKYSEEFSTFCKSQKTYQLLGKANGCELCIENIRGVTSVRTDSGGLRLTLVGVIQLGERRDSFDPRDKRLNDSSVEVGVKFPGHTRHLWFPKALIRKQNKTKQKPLAQITKLLIL